MVRALSSFAFFPIVTEALCIAVDGSDIVPKLGSVENSVAVQESIGQCRVESDAKSVPHKQWLILHEKVSTQTSTQAPRT